MSQKHIEQFGTFHITTCARGRVPWCTMEGVPEILMENMKMSAHLYETEIVAWCILPNHMHMIVRPGRKGLSAFMHSFKRNSMWQIHNMYPNRPFPGAEVHEPPLRGTGAGFAIFWQHGFHDERIRDDDQLDNAIGYVESNACHHELVIDPLHWPWTSLHGRDDPYR